MPGPYQIVRHPLYVGWLFAFWATPIMSAAHPVFVVTTTVYILIVIRLEERDLLGFHGSAYAKYRTQVPMLIPIQEARVTGSQGESAGRLRRFITTGEMQWRYFSDKMHSAGGRKYQRWRFGLTNVAVAAIKKRSGMYRRRLLQSFRKRWELFGSRLARAGSVPCLIGPGGYRLRGCWCVSLSLPMRQPVPNVRINNQRAIT
jgi:hypothetical protein